MSAMSQTGRPTARRWMAALVLAALGMALAACSGGGMNSFDPSDLLDFMDTKKKLPGERRPVFPEGVPGLEQGVPQELYRDNIERERAEEAAAAAAAAEQQPEPPPAASRPRRAAKPAQSTPRRAIRPAAAPAEEPAAPPPQAAPPVQQQAAPPAAQPPAFPAPLPSGSFGR